MDKGALVKTSPLQGQRPFHPNWTPLQQLVVLEKNHIIIYIP